MDLPRSPRPISDASTPSKRRRRIPAALPGGPTLPVRDPNTVMLPSLEDDDAPTTSTAPQQALPASPAQPVQPGLLPPVMSAQQAKSMPPSPIETSPAKHVYSTKTVVAELMHLEAQRKYLQEEIKRLSEATKQYETKLITYMQKNDIIKIAINDLSYLELRLKQYREKPKAKVMLQRLAQILATGERNAETIFRFMRAPVKITPRQSLSKRQKRKEKRKGKVRELRPGEMASAVAPKLL